MIADALHLCFGECAETDNEINSLIEPVALDVIAIRPNTPLQFSERLNRAFKAGFRTGQQPVTAEIVTATLTPDFDDLEPRLTRQGYSPKVLADQFHAKPSEIRRFLSGQLDAGRTRELADRMRAVGLALYSAASVRTTSVSVSAMWVRLS